MLTAGSVCAVVLLADTGVRLLCSSQGDVESIASTSPVNFRTWVSQLVFVSALASKPRRHEAEIRLLVGTLADVMLSPACNKQCSDKALH